MDVVCLIGMFCYHCINFYLNWCTWKQKFGVKFEYVFFSEPACPFVCKECEMRLEIGLMVDIILLFQECDILGDQCFR